MSLSTTQCEAFKGALARETGRIQAYIQWKLKGYDGFALSVVPEKDYDMRMGENPRSIRYRKSRMIQEDYAPFLAQGTESRDFESEGCDGSTETISALAAKNSQCETVGSKVYMGYEEFTRTAKRTAIESEIICILTILEKKAPGEYIRALREAMVESAVERYDRSVLKDMTNLAYHKTAVTSYYHQNEGSAYFPAVPEGVLNIGTLKRLRDQMDSWNYNEGARGPTVDGMPVLTIYCGRQAMEQAIENYLRSKGVQRTQDYTMIKDTKFGMTRVFEGIQFIITKKPTRGWLRQVSATEWEFVEVLPTYNVAAGAEGIVERPNPDYYNCYTTCEGRKQKLYEIGSLPHPQAFERQRFSIPSIDPIFSKMGAKYASFDVMMLNDTILWDGCGLDGNPVAVKNEDRLKAKMKIVHGYAPFSMYPEKMGAIIYEASPDPIEVYPSTCINECTDSTVLRSIGLDEHPPLQPCNDCGTTLREEDRDPLFTDRTGTDPYPTNGPGTIRMVDCTITAGGDETALQVCVERIGGDEGEAVVLLNTANGTATAGTDYTAVVNSSITWEDGESGQRCITITLAGNTPANAGLNFTVTVTADGATVPNAAAITAVDCDVTTVTFEDPADCESEPEPCGC